MSNQRQRRFPQCSVSFLLFLLGVIFSQTVRAQVSPAHDAPTANVASQQAPADNAELTSRDNKATFKVRVNLVLVRVVVRDPQGKVVRNLRKEDFQLLDNRKPQVISSFSVETPESSLPKPATEAAAPVAAPDNDATAVAPIVKVAKRFVIVVFDDVHLLMEDATFVRDAATRFFGALSSSDRVAIYTTSGQFAQEFTDDQDALQKALLQIVPRPVNGLEFHDCPEVGYYQADLIENQRDEQALGVATEDAIQCAFHGDRQQALAARSLAEAAALRALTAGDNQTSYTFQHLEDAVKRLAGMPGQRVMVLVSPGFIPSRLWPETSELVDRATRANIVINTIDARGLFTPNLMGDIADPPHDAWRTAGFKASYRVTSQLAENNILRQLADGTGGTFFHDRNDVDEGLRQAGAAPALSYVLGFSPQNLKIDGKYHALKVSLTSQQKFAIQARHGYYAPRTIADPAESAKLEIQEALFSQEEIHDLPVDFQTQFFKQDATRARLAVLTHVDLKGIRFRKAEGRNRDNLTIATAIFDENGNFVTGGEKIVEMKLLDTTYDRLSHSGLTLKSSFDLKPGTYLVRLVVRDAEGSQLAARNGAVSIPY